MARALMLVIGPSRHTGHFGHPIEVDAQTRDVAADMYDAVAVPGGDPAVCQEAMEARR